MNAEQLKLRTKVFAVQIIQLVRALPRDVAGEVIARQPIRSATSVAANYRAACRARSPAEFVSKMGVVEEEADESLFWQEMPIASKIVPADRLGKLMQEASELVAIAVASKRTARARAAVARSCPPNRQSSVVNRKSQ